MKEKELEKVAGTLEKCRNLIPCLVVRSWPPGHELKREALKAIDESLSALKQVTAKEEPQTVVLGFASWPNGEFELIVKDNEWDKETTLCGKLKKGQFEKISAILPTCVFVNAALANAQKGGDAPCPEVLKPDASNAASTSDPKDAAHKRFRETGEHEEHDPPGGMLNDPRSPRLCVACRGVIDPTFKLDRSLRLRAMKAATRIADEVAFAEPMPSRFNLSKAVDIIIEELSDKVRASKESLHQESTNLPIAGCNCPDCLQFGDHFGLSVQSLESTSNNLPKEGRASAEGETVAVGPCPREEEVVCRRCNIEMVVGIATEQTWVMGLPDFIGNDVNSAGQTLNVGGSGRVIPCLKCPKCGHSVSIGVPPPQPVVNDSPKDKD